MRLIGDSLEATFTTHFDSGNCTVTIEGLAPARVDATPVFSGIVASEISRRLPTHAEYNPAIWDDLLRPDVLGSILQEQVTANAATTYQDLCNGSDRAATHAAPMTMRHDLAAAQAEREVVNILTSESRTAALLGMLHENGQHSVLESLFYGSLNTTRALWEAVLTVDDPFATIDPTRQLDRVGLSPVGIAHLFRQYFFELDTFLGTPVGHVWLSPGSTVELIEVHTRRVLVEQTVEQSLESIHKSEKSVTQQDDISDAVKQENRTDTKLGVNVSANQSWGWGSANESASFEMNNTEQKAREETHKTMRQQSEKLSSEIKQSFKTTFRTQTETTDMSSKRYLLTNATEKLVNYELRRKMRQVAVQVQDIGSYLCWQTYVDDPGKHLGIGSLVHIGAPPDLSKIPMPDLIVPPQAFSEDRQINIPFLTTDDGETNDTFDNGTQTDTGTFAKDDHIIADIKQGPIRCSQASFKLVSVALDAQGADAQLSVDVSTIQPDPAMADAYTFVVHLNHINFQGANSIPVKATLQWVPIVDIDAVKAENAKRLAMFTSREDDAFRKAFLEVARERIKLASNIQPRRAEDLREEERVIVYRALIQDMLEPETFIPQPDNQTHHIVAELIDSIFDVDKLLYFVAPEWWRPRLHHSHQQLGGVEMVADPVTGKNVGATATVPAADTLSWGDSIPREDNYYITEESTPARLGSSLGWFLELDGDDLRNAFLNAPWVKAVLPIRPGKEKAALNWLRHVEGMNGIGPGDLYEGPEPEWHGKKTMLDVLDILAARISAKHDAGNQTTSFADPLDDKNTVRATPVDRVYEHGFDPLKDGFQAKVTEDYEIFDQWIEILPTDQVAAVEVSYDPKTGRQI